MFAGSWRFSYRKSEMVGKVQISGRCIFCNSPGLSKEHVWSDWITKRKLIPVQASHEQNYYRTSVDHISRKQVKFPSKTKTLQGPMVQKKVRKVCVNCNNNWMSEIVKNSIECAEKMIKGEDLIVDLDNQTKLSAWIALSCIMVDYVDDRAHRISLEDRLFVMENHAPGSLWSIHVGKYCGTNSQPSNYLRSGVSLNVLPIGSIDPTKMTKQYCFMITYVIGGMAVHAVNFSHRMYYDKYNEHFAPAKMQRIWPAGNDFSFSPTSVSDEDLSRMHNQFLKYLSRGGYVFPQRRN